MISGCKTFLVALSFNPGPALGFYLGANHEKQRESETFTRVRFIEYSFYLRRRNRFLRYRETVSYQAKKGDIAGYVNKAGYRVVKINQQIYRCCRLVYKIITGEDPKGEVDHINRIRSDDRWINLRDLSASDNCRNRNAGRKHYYPCGKMWRVRLRINNRLQHIGTFQDEELAALVAQEARDKFYGGIA